MHGLLAHVNVAKRRQKAHNHPTHFHKGHFRKKVTEKAQQYSRYCISEGGGPLIPGEEGPKETGEVTSNSLPGGGGIPIEVGWADTRWKSHNARRWICSAHGWGGVPRPGGFNYSHCHHACTRDSCWDVPQPLGWCPNPARAQGLGTLLPAALPNPEPPSAPASGTQEMPVTLGAALDSHGNQVLPMQQHRTQHPPSTLWLFHAL